MLFLNDSAQKQNSKYLCNSTLVMNSTVILKLDSTPW
jgi:hypothetical protein